METIIKRIRGLAEESGLTLRDLSEATGYSKSAMQRYLAGERDLPLSAVEGLARVFHVVPAYIMGWTDDRHFDPEQEEKPATEPGDELTESQKLLMEFAQSLSDDEAERVLETMTLLVQGMRK